MKIEVNKEIAKGTYSNLAILSHSHDEFILDFAVRMPGLEQIEVASRIVMSPENTKRLLAALQDNIGKYESRFGTIELGAPTATYNMGGFGGNGGSMS